MSHKNHSSDYKKLAIEYYLVNGSLRKTCELFKCNKSTLYDWVVNDINKVKRKRKQRIKIYSTKIRDYIIKYTKTNVISTLKQIQNEVKQKFDVKPSITLIYEILESNKITRKRLVKKYFPAKRKNIEKDLLKMFYTNVRKYKYTDIICLDETAVYINMLPSYGSSESGKQAIKRTEIYPYKKYNLIVAMKYNKIIGWELNKESYDTTKLSNFIEKHLNKYKKHLLIFDNAIFHKSKKVIEILDKYNIEHQYIVPYHPENNPIERLFSQIKSYLNIANCQSFDEIYDTLKSIMKHNILANNLKSYILTLF